MKGEPRFLWTRPLRSLQLAIIECCLIFVFAAPSLLHADTSSTDTLPMFGQPKIARSEDLKKADETFIRDSTLRYGNRQAGSNTLAAQGWTAVRSRQA